MLDVRQPGATDIVGDRALGSEPMQVVALGRAILETGSPRPGARGDQAYSGPWPRAGRQPQELPVVDAGEEELAVDLEPFERLRDAAMGMTSAFALHRGTPSARRRSRRSSSTTSFASGSASTVS